MLFVTHSITGATIGVFTGNPILAFFSGLISHHLLDSLPHFDQGSFYTFENKGPVWLGAKYKDGRNGHKFTGRGSLRDWIVLYADFAVAGAIGLTTLFYLPAELRLLYILGGLGGILSDVLDTSPFWKYKFRATKFGKYFHAVHNFFHWPLPFKYVYFGVGIQVVIVALAAYFIRGLF